MNRRSGNAGSLHRGGSGSARSCRSRPEFGLTTLEWLLIVAAVAGLAALAVVLVQNVVDETAEEISGGSARVTAARVAAARVSSDVVSEIEEQFTPRAAPNNNTFDTSDINADLMSKCERLEITYSDVSLVVTWNPTLPASITATDASQLTTVLAGTTWTNPDRCMITSP